MMPCERPSKKNSKRENKKYPYKRRTFEDVTNPNNWYKDSYSRICKGGKK